MPRPCKCRRICSVPRITRFDAAGEPHSEPVTIGLDELEVLRLLDRENLSQQQCAVRMQVSRPTVARMYENVRKKLAEALTEGKSIHLAGGDIQVCTEPRPECRGVRNCCHRKKHSTVMDLSLIHI